MWEEENKHCFKNAICFFLLNETFLEEKWLVDETFFCMYSVKLNKTKQKRCSINNSNAAMTNLHFHLRLPFTILVSFFFLSFFSVLQRKKKVKKSFNSECESIWNANIMNDLCLFVLGCLFHDFFCHSLATCGHYHFHSLCFDGWHSKKNVGGGKNDKQTKYKMKWKRSYFNC